MSEAAPEPPPKAPAPGRFDPVYVNGMVHFYRGELGRIMVWRQRLDVTTTWAIATSTTLFTVAFTVRDVPSSSSFSNC